MGGGAESTSFPRGHGVLLQCQCSVHIVLKISKCNTVWWWQRRFRPSKLLWKYTCIRAEVQRCYNHHRRTRKPTIDESLKYDCSSTTYVWSRSIIGCIGWKVGFELCYYRVSCLSQKHVYLQEGTPFFNSYFQGILVTWLFRQFLLYRESDDLTLFNIKCPRLCYLTSSSTKVLDEGCQVLIFANTSSKIFTTGHSCRYTMPYFSLILHNIYWPKHIFPNIDNEKTIVAFAAFFQTFGYQY